MNTTKQRLDQLHAIIRQAELAANRPVGAVQLLAVSKTKPASDIVAAYHAGQRHFAESYVQEALIKQAELGAYAITWHFIGPIQANKTKAIASRFDWVHSVDRLKIAERLNEQRPDTMPPLNVCLQVNISRESSKSGIMLEDLAAWIPYMQSLPRLCWRGIMAIPEPETEFALQRIPFRKLFNALKQLNRPDLDTLSMGMSNDLEAAIAEGSTIVRIGTALFGSRNKFMHEIAINRM